MYKGLKESSLKIKSSFFFFFERWGVVSSGKLDGCNVITVMDGCWPTKV